MKITRVLVPQEKLNILPENELVFFIQMGTLLNELNILHKLIIFSTKEVMNETERKAQNTQALFLLRTLALKLNEGWRLIKKGFYKSQISKDYYRRVDETAKNNLYKLKKYFRNDNLIERVRKRFSAHYDSEEIKNQIQRIQKKHESEIFEIFISEEHANCLYYMSEVYLNSAISESADILDVHKTIDELSSDIMHIARCFLDFLGDCMRIIAEKYPVFHTEEIEIPEPPVYNEIAIPYFVRRKGGNRLQEFFYWLGKLFRRIKFN
jgi:hypothetical protein